MKVNRDLLFFLGGFIFGFLLMFAVTMWVLSNYQESITNVLQWCITEIAKPPIVTY